MYISGKKVFDTVKDAKTTAEYVVARLVDLGIQHSFSVPGDFAFSIDRALIHNKKLQNIVNANELNASYAADGYARVKGAAILCTTYAVGELSALNGVMGSKAENVVVFHLVGAPGDQAVAKHKVVHHTLGDGVFGNFFDLSASAACVSALITPDNAVREMNRVIKEAFKNRQPAYIQVGLDDGNRPVTDTSLEDNHCDTIKSIPSQLQIAFDLIIKKLSSAKKIVAIPSVKLDRFGVTDKARLLIEKLNIPYVIMSHDKTVLTENHKQYAGFYSGLLSDEGTSELVENADVVLNIGDAFWSDFNTGAFTYNLDHEKVLNIAPLFVEDNKLRITNVYISELLDLLIQKACAINYVVDYKKPKLQCLPTTHDRLTIKSFYNQLLNFLESSDTFVVETGTSSLNLPKFPLPSGTKYHNQTLWGSIGWATPATLGVALAKPESRVVLVTGEGSHQLTLNEIGVMGRYKINPIIFCINNNGFMVERGLEKDPYPSYDDLAQLNYSKLPESFGCQDWLSYKVTTEQELKDALNHARKHQKGGVYIELITGELDYGDSLEFFNKHLKQMYS